MKKYFKDLDTETKINIILNNEDLKNAMSQDYYEYNMEMQLEEGQLMFGKESHKYIEIRDNYSSFYLRLINWFEFIRNLDKDYLCNQGIDLYNEIMKLYKEYEDLENIEKNYKRIDELEEELESRSKELLSICEKQLHEYESFTEEDLKEYIQFNLEENDIYSDYYIIDDDYSKVYVDITKTFE